MKDKLNKCPGCKRESCDGCGLKRAGHIQTLKNQNVEFPDGFVFAEKEGLGAAFDIGTTTLAGMLYCLKDGKRLQSAVRVNPQVRYGADVISRIAFGIQKKENQAQLQEILVKAMDEMIIEMSNKQMTEQKDITLITAVGNTAMCEILLGCDLESLSCAPFKPAYQGTVWKKGEELLLTAVKEANVAVLPCAGGFVGADALSVSICMKYRNSELPVMAVDIGTNGEIILAGSRHTYICSAAAGPALEGACVSQGMRASQGAVDSVSLLDGDIEYHVIGGGAPRGICGSGLIDSMALLFEAGVLDETGYLLTVKEAVEKGVSGALVKRIREEAGSTRFLMTDELNPVYLTAIDLRQLQLAKGAIRAGIEILLDKEGIDGSGLKALYLAGAFGSYIRIESAVRIGMIPFVNPTVHLGNSAGTGAAMALLSSEIIQEMNEDAALMIHVELAEEEKFKEYFMKYLNLQF